MGKPLMIQLEDDNAINTLKGELGFKSKVDVVRAGLRLLEHEVQRRKRVQRWKRAVNAARATSLGTNREFQTHSRLKRVDR